MTTDTVTKHYPLTPKQEAFALFLYRGISQRDAYLKAGYSSNQLPNTIDRAASGLASTYKIVARVKELQAKAESDAIGDVTERKKRLTDIYRANLVDFLDEKGQVKLSKDVPHHSAVSEYSISQDDGGLITKKTLKLRDPIAAIQEQNKMERIGQVDTAININNDNRSVTIVVASEKGRLALESLKSGKLPQLQGKMVGQ